MKTKFLSQIEVPEFNGLLEIFSMHFGGSGLGVNLDRRFPFAFREFAGLA